MYDTLSIKLETDVVASTSTPLVMDTPYSDSLESLTSTPDTSSTTSPSTSMIGSSPKSEPKSPVSIPYCPVAEPNCLIALPYDPLMGPKSTDHHDDNDDDCPPTKRRKVLVEEMLTSLKTMDPPAQFELWRRMLQSHPFDLEQLNILKTTIKNRLKFDIVSSVPCEIAAYIMSFLAPKDLCQAAQTCKSWQSICDDNRLWREKCSEEGLLKDQQILSVIMEKHIAQKNVIQEKFASEYTSAMVPKNHWKSAFSRHINILRNWKLRDFHITEPVSGPRPRQTAWRVRPRPTILEARVVGRVQHPQPQQPIPHQQVARARPAPLLYRLYPVPNRPDQLLPLPDPLQHQERLKSQQQQQNQPQPQPQAQPSASAQPQLAQPMMVLRPRPRPSSSGYVQQLQQTPQLQPIAQARVKLEPNQQAPQLQPAEGAEAAMDQAAHQAALQAQLEQSVQDAHPNHQEPQLADTQDQSGSNSSESIDNENEERRDLMTLQCHEDSVITCLQYNPKTNIIVSGSDDQTLKVWCSETGRCLSTLEGHNGGVWASQLSPDDMIVSGSTDRTLRVWEARTGKLIHTLHGHTSTVRCLALCGDKVVSGSRDTTLRLWDIKQGRCLNVFLGHTAAVRCVEFKGDRIVSGAYDHLVMVWDATTGEMLHSLECHENRIYSLQYDGKIIASGSLDTTICIWDAETGQLRHRLQGHNSLTSKMQLKGNILVSANADSSCKIWDVDTGKCLKTLGDMHTSAVTSVFIDNWHVVTSSDDGTVKLWDIETGQYLRDLVVLPSAVSGGVVWRIRASYTKLICAVGSRNTTPTDDTRLLVLDFK